MPALYDSKGSSFPSNAFVDHVFLNESTGDRFVKKSDGNWVLMDNVLRPYGGALPSAGGVVDNAITGASGMAPEANANIRESLRLEDIDVVTVAMLKGWEERIYAQLNSMKNTSKGSTLLDPANSVSDSIVFNHGMIAIKHGKSYDFGDSSGVLGDIRPRFSDQSRPAWESCYFYAALAGIADPKAMNDAPPTGDAFVPVRFVNGLNLGYSSGYGFKYDRYLPPKITAFAVQKDMEHWLSLVYRVIGVR